MIGTSLPLLCQELLEKARTASSGRAAVTLHGGMSHTLRQTVIALAEGHSLGEHDSPAEATLQVLLGEVGLTAGDEVWSGAVGDHLVIPADRHDLAARTDAVVLLTVTTRA